ncbi:MULTISPECIES: hypothetical protein [Terribacillus]|uniref:Uncharacterized protein n=1 Tax=Terribacillus saccharophilus TaxID=361277 RepID=A0AAX2EDQ8_9BACI|nr:MULTISPECIES: hypothetical protein [Terribacillus]QXE03580.1 hypothetical protein KS242_17490 [Terribacillus sp. DMT04]SEM86839.1 hypothetical protein SAMN04489762_1249 [Terribacillus saccharophilus]
MGGELTSEQRSLLLSILSLIGTGILFGGAILAFYFAYNNYAFVDPDEVV